MDNNLHTYFPILPISLEPGLKAVQRTANTPPKYSFIFSIEKKKPSSDGRVNSAWKPVHSSAWRISQHYPRIIKILSSISLIWHYATLKQKKHTQHFEASVNFTA
jgi:hypothetical protein